MGTARGKRDRVGPQPTGQAIGKSFPADQLEE
jgi:hypothetical protein